MLCFWKSWGKYYPMELRAEWEFILKSWCDSLDYFEDWKLWCENFSFPSEISNDRMKCLKMNVEFVKKFVSTHSPEELQLADPHCFSTKRFEGLWGQCRRKHRSSTALEFELMSNHVIQETIKSQIPNRGKLCKSVERNM